MPGLSVSTSNAHDLTLPVEVLAKTVAPHHGTGQINGITCDQGANGIRTGRDFRPAFRTPISTNPSRGVTRPLQDSLDRRVCGNLRQSL